jgi:hypothetical protein
MIATDIWNGFHISLIEGRPGEFAVSFWPRELMQYRNPGGTDQPVSPPARVTIATKPAFAVTTYSAPERSVEGLTEEDYRSKAVELVRDELANRQNKNP